MLIRVAPFTSLRSGRFYFLADDELLEILAQVRDPHAVQPHLRKCFDMIQKLNFGKGVDILGMVSPKGEDVPFVKLVKARGSVEEWLTTIQEMMQTTVKARLKECTFDYHNHSRTDWITEAGHTGQSIATAAQIMWTAETERVLSLAGDELRTEMAKWEEINCSTLLDMTAIVRKKIPKLLRRIVVALVTTDVHARDIVIKLNRDKVDTVGNFTWQQQLRYYWDTDKDECVWKHGNAQNLYQYEYMGCASRLVITPLTDRCWLTITGAMHLSLGASPAGPAGTGKTESSKDLAKAIGTFCVVFNCSDQIDYKMLAKLFSGLAQCGCWTCLDEFNRIDIEVLSVVAQQLSTLRIGRLQRRERITFSGRNILLLPHIVIVTMNPGYAGR